MPLGSEKPSRQLYKIFEILIFGSLTIGRLFDVSAFKNIILILVIAVEQVFIHTSELCIGDRDRKLTKAVL